eukprot:g69112.t1
MSATPKSCASYSCLLVASGAMSEEGAVAVRAQQGDVQRLPTTPRAQAEKENGSAAQLNSTTSTAKEMAKSTTPAWKEMLHSTKASKESLNSSTAATKDMAKSSTPAAKEMLKSSAVVKKKVKSSTAAKEAADSSTEMSEETAAGKDNEGLHFPALLQGAEAAALPVSGSAVTDGADNTDKSTIIEEDCSGRLSRNPSFRQINPAFEMSFAKTHASRHAASRETSHRRRPSRRRMRSSPARRLAEPINPGFSVPPALAANPSVFVLAASTMAEQLSHPAELLSQLPQQLSGPCSPDRADVSAPSFNFASPSASSPDSPCHPASPPVNAASGAAATHPTPPNRLSFARFVYLFSQVGAASSSARTTPARANDNANANANAASQHATPPRTTNNNNSNNNSQSQDSPNRTAGPNISQLSGIARAGSPTSLSSPDLAFTPDAKHGGSRADQPAASCKFEPFSPLHNVPLGIPEHSESMLLTSCSSYVLLPRAEDERYRNDSYLLNRLYLLYNKLVDTADSVLDLAQESRPDWMSTFAAQVRAAWNQLQDKLPTPQSLERCQPAGSMGYAFGAMGNFGNNGYNQRRPVKEEREVLDQPSETSPALRELEEELKKVPLPKHIAHNKQHLDLERQKMLLLLFLPTEYMLAWHEKHLDRQLKKGYLELDKYGGAFTREQSCASVKPSSPVRRRESFPAKMLPPLRVPHQPSYSVEYHSGIQGCDGLPCSPRSAGTYASPVLQEAPEVEFVVASCVRSGAPYSPPMSPLAYAGNYAVLDAVGPPASPLTSYQPAEAYTPTSPLAAYQPAQAYTGNYASSSSSPRMRAAAVNYSTAGSPIVRAVRSQQQQPASPLQQPEQQQPPPPQSPAQAAAPAKPAAPAPAPAVAVPAAAAASATEPPKSFLSHFSLLSAGASSATSQQLDRSSSQLLALTPSFVKRVEQADRQKRVQAMLDAMLDTPAEQPERPSAGLARPEDWSAQQVEAWATQIFHAFHFSPQDSLHYVAALRREEVDGSALTDPGFLSDRWLVSALCMTKPAHRHKFRKAVATLVRQPQQ